MKENNDSIINNKTVYNKYVYNKDGYNKDGWNRKGFNRDGIHRDTGTNYNLKGYDKNGFDKTGFSIYRNHRDTKTKYDPEGYDIKGYNKEGYNKEGYNKEGFNKSGIHRDTGTTYSPKGYDAEGYNQDGYNTYGYNRDGYKRDGFDRYGFDREGYRRNGFNKDGIHKDTGTKYNPEGYDARGYNKEGWNPIKGYDRDGYNQDGYDKYGYDRDGYNRDGYNQNGINKYGINRKTGEKDKSVRLVERFINSKKTIKAFAEENGMDMRELQTIIEQTRMIPCIKESLDEALADNSRKYFFVIRHKIEKLLNGEISIKYVKSVDVLLKECSADEKQKITEMLVTEMISHEISILEYRKIFGIEEINASLPQNILLHIDGIKKIANKQHIRELYKEIDRVKSYKMPYMAADGETIGYKENPDDKQIIKVDITDEHRNMAREYLKAINEYICNKTMQITLLKIVKGEINSEIIKRAKKERQLLNLQQENTDLDELIEQSEQFLNGSQNKKLKTQVIEDVK